MNDLSGDLASNPKLFVEDTSLFSVVENITKSHSDLNNDLAKIRTCAFQWKMNFNPYLSKQSQEDILVENFKNPNHSCLIFNHNTVNLPES